MSDVYARSCLWLTCCCPKMHQHAHITFLRQSQRIFLLVHGTLWALVSLADAAILHSFAHDSAASPRICQ